MVPPSTDGTLYVFFDDGARVYVDHELVMDGWENATFASDESCTRCADEGAFHDLVAEWRELTGAARVRLAWSSYSVVGETVPSTVPTTRPTSPARRSRRSRGPRTSPSTAMGAA